jgi:imidazolonepropionase
MIGTGKVANVFITQPMSSLAAIPYSFGSNPVDRVILNGKLIDL